MSVKGFANEEVANVNGLLWTYNSDEFSWHCEDGQDKTSQEIAQAIAYSLGVFTFKTEADPRFPEVQTILDEIADAYDVYTNEDGLPEICW